MIMIYKNIRNNKVYLVSEMDTVTRNINITRTSQLDKKFVIMGLYDGSVFFTRTIRKYRKVSGDFKLYSEGHKISFSKDIIAIISSCGWDTYKVDKDTPVIFIKNMVIFKYKGNTKVALKSKISLMVCNKRGSFTPKYYIRKYCKIPKSLKISNKIN